MISSGKLHRLSAGIVFSFITICICVLLLLIYISYNPNFIKNLSESALNYKITDKMGNILKEGPMNELKEFPDKSRLLSMKILLPPFCRISKLNCMLYLTPVQSPVRIKSKGTTIFTRGNFIHSIPPKELDIVIPVNVPGDLNFITLEYQLSSFCSRDLAFLKRSGFGSQYSLTMTKLAKTFLTNTGNLALSIVFITISMILFLTWLNSGKNYSYLYLMLATISQAWIALWFSRHPYSFLSNTDNLHRFSFVIYFLFLVFYTFFLNTSIKSSFFKRIYFSLSISGGIIALSLVFSGLFFNLNVSFFIYKKALIFAFIAFFVLAFSESFLHATRENKTTFSRFLIPSASWIIATGHANDILRVYSHSITPYNLGPYSFFLGLNLYLVYIVYHIYVRYNQTLARELEHSRLAAIGETTQMLAHDIRKPFSQIRTVLNLFDTFKNNPRELEKAKKSIEKNADSVETMLGDIIDFSREIELITQPRGLTDLLEFSIKQVAGSHQNAKIRFEYRPGHSLKPLVDDLRITRVFSNITGNAVEAISDAGEMNSGTVTISSRDIERNGKAFTEIIIGNNGPEIKEEDLPKLFESFFTKGKSRGTGLGLASAHKIISLHGGDMIAQNRNSEPGVEFIIHLPASTERDESTSRKLPATLRDVLSIDYSQEEREIYDLIKKIVKKHTLIKILLLEDEALYRASVRNTVESNEILKKILRIYEASSTHEAMNIVRQERITHAIVDIDLKGKSSGFDFLNQLAVENYPVKTMIHTNRLLNDKSEFLNIPLSVKPVPKPLRLEDLALFLCPDDSLSADETPSSDKNLPEKTGKKKSILYCDDDLIMRLNIKNLIRQLDPEIELFEFENAENLLKKLLELKSCHAVITDQNMGDGMSGTTLIERIKSMKIPCKTFIISNTPSAILKKAPGISCVDGFLEAPVCIEDLKKILNI